MFFLKSGQPHLKAQWHSRDLSCLILFVGYLFYKYHSWDWRVTSYVDIYFKDPISISWHALYSESEWRSFCMNMTILKLYLQVNDILVLRLIMDKSLILYQRNTCWCKNTCDTDENHQTIALQVLQFNYHLCNWLCSDCSRFHCLCSRIHLKSISFAAEFITFALEFVMFAFKNCHNQGTQ